MLSLASVPRAIIQGVAYLFGILFQYLQQAPAHERLAVSLIPLVCLCLAAYADPKGALNQFLLTIVFAFEKYLPTTPDNLKIGNLVYELGTQVPLLGIFIHQAVLGARDVIGLIVVQKLIKSLPFV